MTNAKFHLIVSIDTECDKGVDWRIKQPIQFENILSGIPRRLQPIFEEFKIVPTYLLSPEVMIDKKSVALFCSLGDKAELGTHLHSEFIPPHENFKTDYTGSFQSSLPPEVEYEKLKNLTQLFADRFGYLPRSFRAGRFGLSRYTLNFLEKLGYAVDSSVTPYHWWWEKRGVGVNFLGAPVQPYFPSPKDFRERGKMRILEVPVTLTNRFWDRIPSSILRRINPIARWQTILLNIFLGKYQRSLWLRPTYSTAEEMLSIGEYLSAKPGSGRLILCMMFHSNEATAGTSPYNLTETDVSRFLQRMRTYFQVLFSNFNVEPIALSQTVNLK
jgi:hypothetical protein